MPKKPTPKRRSGCALNASVEMLGDRWSLLIIRDMMLRGFRTYNEFLTSHEGIATNILADRLRKLQGHGIITTARDPRMAGINLRAHEERNRPSPSSSRNGPMGLRTRRPEINR